MTSDSPTGHLRNSPRQARSAARVELLLDAAGEVFEEVGFDAATTNMVAARADVPVGTLYRWFPDKTALAEALADRYLVGLEAAYRDIPAGLTPEVRIGEYLRQVIAHLAVAVQGQRALPALLVSAMVPGRRSSAGERLRAGLIAQVRTLIDLRIPGLPTDVRDETAEVCVTLTHLVIAAAANDEDEDHRQSMMNEYTDALIAYLEAKFPSVGSSAWTDPDVAVTPRFPAPDRAARVAALTDR